ncbi:MAG: hypothetical protein GY852_03080 [bacterium]|nr:hypothetical protein [bacterium]
MKHSHGRDQSHRVTATRRLSRVKTVLKAQESPSVRNMERASMQGFCMNAHRNGIGKGAAAVAVLGMGALAAKEASAEEAHHIMLIEEKEDVQMKADIPMSPEVSTALAIAAMVSAASTVFFGVRAYKTRRKVPGIIGPSGLVPSKSKRDIRNANPFPELVGDDEFARIRKEMRIWGIKNRKEKYYLHMNAENMDVRLVPRDFKYTFNKNTLPALASLFAAMAFTALCLAGKEYPVKAAEPAKVEQKDASAQ